MRVLRKYNPRVDVKWFAATHPSYGFSKRVNVLDQQSAMAIEQIDGEEIGPTRDAIAAVIRHG